ncbi:MAG TPA: acyltransferase [Capsulimonadaceae bacterium]|jgi:peptidoglycan/LPS O-acetylase OafA/YrhL
MADTNVKRGAYKHLDAWRGVASLWVVLYHATMPIAEKYQFVTASPVYFISKFGCFGVWMFFVVSGYCIANAASNSLGRENGILRYAVARLRRIFPPYWSSAVLYFMFSAVAVVLAQKHIIKAGALASLDVMHQPPLYYVATVTLGQKILHQDYLQGVYWTLCYEVAFYLVMGVSLSLAFKKADARALLNGAHVTTLVALAVLIGTNRHVYPFDLWPCFGIGALIYDLIAHPKVLAPRLVLAALTVEVAWYAAQHHVMNSNVDVGGGISLLFCFVFGLLLIVLHRYDEKIASIRAVKWLSWVGMFSYSLYLTHYMIVSIISKAFDRFGKMGEWYVPCVLLCVAFSILFARAFYQYCERPFVGSKRDPRPAPAGKPWEPQSPVAPSPQEISL